MRTLVVGKKDYAPKEGKQAGGFLFVVSGKDIDGRDGRIAYGRQVQEVWVPLKIFHQVEVVPAVYNFDYEVVPGAMGPRAELARVELTNEEIHTFFDVSDNAQVRRLG